MLTKNLEETLNKFAEYVVSSAKTNLTKDVNKYGKNKGGGNLYNSIKYDLGIEPNIFLVDFLMEDYGIFVDKGVKGKTSTYPETQAALSQFQYGSGTGSKGGLTNGINKWLKKERFQWRNDLGQFMSYESMAYLIARSIYNKGLKANLFFTKPFEQALKNLPVQLSDSFALDIENAIILGVKK